MSKIDKDTNISSLTVSDLVKIIRNEIIVSKYHTNGGICVWGAYPKHFDNCTIENCNYLKAKDELIRL